MANPLRRRNRGLTPEQYTEVQNLVFELVRERLAEAFGAKGMWSVSMREADETDSVFSETVAESLAWDVAAQLAAPAKSRHQAEPAVKKLPEPARPVLVDETASPGESEEQVEEQQLVA